MKLIKRLLLGFLIIIMAGALTACGQELQRVDESSWGMDTLITISVFYMGREGGADARRNRAIAREAADIFEEFDALFDRFTEGSDIWRINHAGGEYVEVSHHTIAVLEQALYFRELSGGRFDVTIGAVMDLWDFTGDGVIPAAADVEIALQSVGSDIIISGNRVRLADPNARIDLGGIAKGYAGDYIGAFLQDRGVSGIVGLSGDTVFVGSRPDGNPWLVGVRAPFSSPLADSRFAIEVWGGSVVSSGTYARYFFRDGRHYHHILDVDTGFPINTPILGATVVAPNATLGEFLTTAMFVLSFDEAEVLVRDMEGVHIIFQMADDNVFHTHGVGPPDTNPIIPFFWLQ
jgi:thiamine biosynthesis lipoprotein